MQLSNDEIFMISDGLYCLIRDYSKAITLIHNKQAQKEINKSIKRVQDLNTKILNEIDKQYT